MRLEPKPGFDWKRIRWDSGDYFEGVCSYCDARIGEDDVPLMLFDGDGTTARFCKACEREWWGFRSSTAGQ
jgi:hypothetical protein